VYVTIFEEEAFVSLILVDKMGPEIALVNKGTLMMTREVINIIKVENVYNVIQFSSTDVIIRQAGINWWVVWTCLALFARL
jgi:hypothetical protein